jgi:predicted extracellular nuclease
MEVSFKTRGVNWTLFNIHLKSRRSGKKGDPESSGFRTREAQVIRDYIRKKFSTETTPRYLVVGDFNDNVQSAALKRFYEVSDERLLYDVEAFDSRGEQWTYNYHGRRLYEQVDYILVSPVLKNNVKQGKARIYDGAEALTASDHRLVYADLEF